MNIFGNRSITGVSKEKDNNYNPLDEIYVLPVVDRNRTIISSGMSIAHVFSTSQ